MQGVSIGAAFIALNGTRAAVIAAHIDATQRDALCDDLGTE